MRQNITNQAAVVSGPLARRRTGIGLAFAGVLALLAWNLTRQPPVAALLWTGHTLSWAVAGLAMLALAARLWVSPLHAGRLGRTVQAKAPRPSRLLAIGALAVAVGTVLDTLL
ncbi:hypothetical protein [Lacticaseibacillus kribbianus]|uniref:hypothetical protein n=1 Tax=Lacticaseibacillus kribbianus TaxID=2926292 RepID=UPI001CD3A715|nr:hypothetical protein [Lacticaseibacillus kribbianus]